MKKQDCIIVVLCMSFLLTIESVIAQPVIASSTFICEEECVTFSIASYVNSSNFAQLYYSDGSTDNWTNLDNKITHCFDKAGVDSVGYFIDDWACSWSGKIYIQVNSIPIVTLGNDTMVCKGNSIALIGGNKLASYLWSDSSTNQNLIVSSTGNYFVHVIDSNGCVATSDTIAVTVLYKSNFSKNPTICIGDSIQVGNNIYKMNGTYTDTLTAANGCDSIVTTNLTVLPNSSFSQNKTINNGDSIKVGNHIYTTSGTYTDTLVASNNCDSIVTTNLIVLTGIEIVGSGNEQLSVKIYPNPFSNSTTVEIQNAELRMLNVELKIYNVLGMEVFKQPIQNPKSEILNPKLPSGIYLYKLTEDKKIIAVGKLVVND